MLMFFGKVFHKVAEVAKLLDWQQQQQQQQQQHALCNKELIKCTSW